MDTPTDLAQRVAALEARLENAWALDARLKELQSAVDKGRRSSVRDWIATLGPYMSGIVVLLVGFWIKDSVALALQREQLDLAYATQMRDLIKGFDESSSLADANANAVALALFGKYAVMPLVERLEGGDVAHLAAERGLRLVGSNDPSLACPKFVEIVRDRAHRFTWQTHKTLARVIGQSCTDPQTLAALRQYRVELDQVGGDPRKISAFARRYSEPQGFDVESQSTLHETIDEALRIIESRVKS